MLGGGGGAGGSLPPGGGGTAKSHLDNTLPDLVREAGYQFTSSLETCRSYLRQWVSSNEILSATVARIIGVMVRTHTGNKWNIYSRLFLDAFLAPRDPKTADFSSFYLEF